MIANKLILGTVQIGLPYGINNTIGQIPVDRSLLLLKNAFEAGISYLDTAEAYGNAHEIIGNYHLEYPKKKFEILTKLPHEFSGGVKEKFLKYVDELHVNSILGFSFHSFDTYQKAFALVSEELELLKKLGYIQKIGVSVYTNEEALVVLQNPAIDIIQLPFNLLDNINLRYNILQEAKNKGVEIHVRSCFLQGLFFMDLHSTHAVAKRLHVELSKIHEIAKKYTVSVNDLALNYVYQNPLIDKILIGVDSSEQLVENLKSLDSDIPVEAFHEVNKITVEHIDLINPTLWKNFG